MNEMELYGIEDTLEFEEFRAYDEDMHCYYETFDDLEDAIEWAEGCGCVIFIDGWSSEFEKWIFIQTA